LIHFRLLRLSGFKSFVDTTEMAIEPGMTGIVGPNGCGKSNLVEGLRWVMGETSARQMRGGEMDDVIFGGTASRPSRNLCEVSLVLDNATRQAPAQFNDFDELEVMRRIDRGQGSLYKVNGKETRAKDVQILFADAATGARSTAIVSQGRIGALISAKPADRRTLLEEAAGIGGLHSRRHEAELRLKAAEANLARLEDVLGALDGQLQGLRRQARQAAKYRTLSDQIRQTEGQLLAVSWALAHRAIRDAQDATDEIERQVATLTGLAAEAAARQIEAATRLPSLREAESQAAAGLHRLTVAREQLESEETRLESARQDMALRVEQANADQAREAARSEDARAALARLEEEADQIASAGEEEPAMEEEAQIRVDQEQEKAQAAEAELGRLMEEVAAADAERAAALRALAEAETRREKLLARQEEMEMQLARAEEELVDQSELTGVEMDLEEALEYLESCREALDSAEHRRAAAQNARERARDQQQTLSAARARLAAEADALRDLMKEAAGSAENPVLDQVTAAAGYEAALGAALGEDLSAPVEAPEAPFRWDRLPPLENAPALPAGIEPLARFVTAPAALARRLSQIGVVEDGEPLRADLHPGQRLVSREGAVWRWDGFTIRAGAPNAAALRLRQRNRLRELEAQLDDAEIGLEHATEQVEHATAQVERETSAERQARDQGKAAEAELAKIRDIHAKLAQRAAMAEQKRAAVAEQAKALNVDIEEAGAALEAARQRSSSFDEDDGRRDLLSQARAALAEQRLSLVEAQSALDRLKRESGDRRRRLELIARERHSWTERMANAQRHREELEERRQAALAELERLTALPLEIAEKRQELMDQLAAAEEARRLAAATLVDGEQALAAADRIVKEAEQSLAQAREERVRRQAAVAAAAQAGQGLAERIRERLQISPEQLVQEIADTVGEIDPSQAEPLQRQFDKLSQEREALGPVNLRAEEEVAELDSQMAVLKAERDDLIAAIAKLRQAIAEINREGRQRLLASFEAVDQHFRELFVRLFGGGRAHLTLTESNDPLQAGLEIMASPPGKRLQILSLLSGGEQALTALSLLFAVFMTNPAPICVLDEVDAPLDDANVDRFCSLVGEIADSSKTRFLVVTHHRMTMARMDRLYGVTMAERGVSTLVSVDLKTAEKIRDA
jgi:chromosome segregation protein